MIFPNVYDIIFYFSIKLKSCVYFIIIFQNNLKMNFNLGATLADKVNNKRMTLLIQNNAAAVEEWNRMRKEKEI